MSMRGISISEFGGPEVLQLKRNLTIPLPKQNQVLIRVRACNVSNQDISLRSGSNQNRNKNLDKPYTPGTEVSGFVEIIGESVTKLNVGDRVYSFNGCKTGGCAQFCVLDENDTFRLPEQLTLKQGACLGRSYFISYVCLVMKGGLVAGQNRVRCENSDKKTVIIICLFNFEFWQSCVDHFRHCLYLTLTS